jgi:hypothetical protein
MDEEHVRISFYILHACHIGTNGSFAGRCGQKVFSGMELCIAFY